MPKEPQTGDRGETSGLETAMRLPVKIQQARKGILTDEHNGRIGVPIVWDTDGSSLSPEEAGRIDTDTLGDTVAEKLVLAAREAGYAVEAVKMESAE